MKITLDWLKEQKACLSGYEWSVVRLKETKEEEAVSFINGLIADDKLSWANWTIVRVFNYKQRVQYAVFAAEQVIDLYEKKYPEDQRPRRAIEAARACVNDASKANTGRSERSAYAAIAAANAAANAAATSAAYAAYAAYAAASAASAAYADYASVDDSDDHSKNEMRMRILRYGISLIIKNIQ